MVWISILSGLDIVLVRSGSPSSQVLMVSWSGFVSSGRHQQKVVPLRSSEEAGREAEPSAAAVSLAVELWLLQLLKMEYQNPAHMTSWWGIIEVSRKQWRRRQTATGWNSVLTLQQRTTTAMERWDSLIRGTADDGSLHILDNNNVFASTGDVLSPIDDEINEINI